MLWSLIMNRWRCSSSSNVRSAVVVDYEQMAVQFEQYCTLCMHAVVVDYEQMAVLLLLLLLEKVGNARLGESD